MLYSVRDISFSYQIWWKIVAFVAHNITTLGEVSIIKFVTGLQFTCFILVYYILDLVYIIYIIFSNFKIVLLLSYLYQII